MPITTKTVSPISFTTPARRLRCGVSHPALALVLASCALSEANAATYTVSNGAELVNAILSANTDGDSASTITLTGTFTIAGNSLPEVTKNLTINIGTNTLVSAGPTVFNVAAGTDLKVDGALRLTGPAGFSTSGRLQKDGAGTLIITGGPSIYAWYAEAKAGNIVIKDGANVTLDSRTGPSTSQSIGPATVTVTGAGTVVRDLGGSNLSDGGTLNIEAGARYINSAAMGHANTAGSSATLNVRGAGSLLDGSLTTARGLGIINVTEGGRIASTSTTVGGSAAIIDQGGAARFSVSGNGSRWDNTNIFTLMRGNLDVLDGGVFETSILRMATVNSSSAQDASLRVSGAGAEFITTSAAANAFQIGGGTGIKQGSVTIANSGKVTVGPGGAGVVNMATSASSRAVLNIGGAEGQVATAAGTLSAGSLQFGPGTSVINFNHTDSAYGFDIAMVGTGTINQVGSGKTVLTANQTAFTGQTNVYAGTLAVNGILGGTMEVLGGRLQGNGIVGDTANFLGGIIAPGNFIGTLTVAGDYTSNGGGLEIEAELGTDNSPTDLLHITGDSLLGTGATQVRVLSVGGAGGVTTGDGIRVVQVDGVSDANAFALAGPAIGGAYRYNLFQNDLTALQNDGDWYLRSAGLAPTVPVYENYPQVLLGMVELPTLQQRVGTRYRAAMTGAEASDGVTQSAIWTRIEGAHGRFKSSTSTSDARFDSDTALVQVGLDGQLVANASGMFVGGITAQYGRVSADIFSSLGDGANTTTSYGIGATLTWYGENGFYVDGQAQIASLRSDLSATGVGSIGDDLHGSGHALSLEAGRKTALGGGWSLTPQAHLAYASVDFDRFTDRFSANVSLRKGDSLKGRLGVAADYERDIGTHVYGIANLTYEFLDGTEVAVSGIDLAFTLQRFGGELGAGGTYAWADGKYALHGEVLAATSFTGGYALKGTVGFTAGF